jgi:hypothetical protein
MSALPIARYRYTARLQAPLRLPDYAGSLLRGQFGAALRRSACMTRQPDCKACPLHTTCPYPRIFEAPAPTTHKLQRFSAIPNAYVVEPPPMTWPTQAPQVLQAGEVLVFHQVLVGDALAQLPLIVLAWQRALSNGLGKQRSVAVLEEVALCGDTPEAQAQVVWQQDAPRVQAHAQTLTPPPWPTGAQGVRLHFHTPLRLQHQGHPIRIPDLTPRDMVAALTRRIALMLEFHAQQAQWGASVPPLVEASRTLSANKHLRWLDWTRYSSRQQQEMTLGGAVGTWEMVDTSTLPALWPWLWLGQWLHMGKNATMGMGGYTLEVI